MINRRKRIFKFYMHNSGHWLGLDVHDAGRYKTAHQWRPLEPGMALTVEPGNLYFQRNSRHTGTLAQYRCTY